MFLLPVNNRQRTSCEYTILTLLLYLLFYPVVTDCDSAPAAAPSTPVRVTAPPTPAFKTPSRDVCQRTIVWDEEDAVPCTSNEMCKDYQTNGGTYCCMAMSCTCGSSANAGTDRCGNFGGESYFVNDVIVPTVTVPTILKIEALTSLPTTAPLSPSSSPSAPDNSETALTSSTTSDNGPFIRVPDITVPTNNYWQRQQQP
jgi:hypothetical protein